MARLTREGRNSSAKATNSPSNDTSAAPAGEAPTPPAASAGTGSESRRATYPSSTLFLRLSQTLRSLPRRWGGQTAVASVVLGSAFAFTQIFSAGPRLAGAEAVPANVPRGLAGAPNSTARVPSSPNSVAAIASSIASSTAIPAVPPTDDPNASTLDLATGLQSRFEEVSRRVSSSVVAISVAIESRGDDDTVRPDDMTGRKLSGILERTTRTVGTGFVISDDGLILTNEHVVSEAEQLWCTTDDGRVLPAYVVGSDPRQDIAVLRVPTGSNLKPVTFADARSVRRGNWALTLGNPYGLAGEGRLSMAVGVVSATGRSLPRLSSKENRLYSDLIQTTAEINPGNSGGPLFDLAGRVIGINTAVVLPQKNTNGIGFALPITASLLTRIDELTQGLEIAYGELGLTVTQPSVRQRRAAGMTTDLGVRIDDVEAAGPSAALLQEGDLILAVNDRPIADLDAFTSATTMLRAGVAAKLTVSRQGKTHSAVVLPRRKPSPATPISRANQRYRWNGMLIGPIPPHWETSNSPTRTRPEFGLMVLAVDAGAEAKGALPPGTVIQALAGRPLRSLADLQNALAATSPDQTALTLWTNATASTAIEPKALSTSSR